MATLGRLGASIRAPTLFSSLAGRSGRGLGLICDARGPTGAPCACADSRNGPNCRTLQHLSATRCIRERWGGGCTSATVMTPRAVSYTHLRAHETDSYLVCRLLLE